MSSRRAESHSRCAWASRAVDHARGELRGVEREQFARHAASCAECAAELEDLRELLAELESAARPENVLAALEPEPGFAGRILSRLPEPSRKRVFARFAVPLAAACLLALCVVVFFTRRQPGADPLDRAVTWLAAAQEPGGGWDPTRFSGSAQYRVGVSGLAIMALAGSGAERVEEPIARGVSFLLASQGDEGLFGSEFPGSNYNQGIATLALLRVRGSSSDARLRQAIDRAILCLLARQLPSGAWGYSDEPAGGSSAVTVWPLQALALARSQGREDVARAVDRGLVWFERSLSGIGSLSQSPAGAGDHICGAASGPAFKAVAVLLRGGGNGREVDLAGREARRALDGVAKALGTRKAGDDPLESYFLTRVLESRDALPLRSLRDEARRAIARRQVTSGPFAGTWEPVGRWSPAGGRLCTTALAALTLESRSGKL